MDSFRQNFITTIVTQTPKNFNSILRKSHRPAPDKKPRREITAGQFSIEFYN